MTTYTYQSVYGDTYKVFISEGVYGNGRKAINLIDAEDGIPVLTATVNIPEYPLEEGEVILKNYSENTGIERFFIENNLGIPTGKIVRTGHLACPVFKLSA